MKTPHHSHWAIGMAFSLLTALGSQAQTPQTTPQVLSRQVVQMADHRVIYERIVPPVERRVGFQTRVPSGPGPALPQPLSLSCSVYENSLTELRWWHEEQLRSAIVPVNFEWLRSVGHFTESGSAYSVFLTIEHQPGRATAQQREQAAQAFDSSSDPTAQGIAALLRHYAANVASLKQTHAQIIATNAARLEALKNQPTTKPDTVIRFWPIQSPQHSGTTTQKRGAAQ